MVSKQALDKPENSSNGLDKDLLKVQGLDFVIHQRQKEVDALVRRRSDLMEQINELERDYDRKGRTMKSQLDSIRQACEFDLSAQKKALSVKEANLNALEAQLNARERDVAQMEERMGKLDEEKKDISKKALSIERLRVQLQQDVEKADQAKVEAQAKLDQIGLLRADLSDRENKIREQQDRLTNLQAILEGREQAVDLREKTMDEAAKAVAPKLAEIDVREEEINRKLAQVTERENAAKEQFQRIREAEEIIEGKQRKINEDMEFIAQEKALIRQQKVDLMVREEKLKPEESGGEG